MKKTLFITACLLSSLAVAQASTLLVNFGGTNVDGWNTVSGSSSSSLSATVTDSSENGYTISYSVSSGNIFSSSGRQVTFSGSDSETNDYNGYTSSLKEMAATLSLDSIDSNVLSTAINDGQNGRTGTLVISGYTAGDVVTIYIITGFTYGSAANMTWALSSGNVGASTTVSYDLSTNTTGSYEALGSASGSVSSADGTGVLIKMTDVVVDDDGYITITSTNGYNVINALAIVTSSVPEPATASLSLLGLGALLLRRRRH